MNNWTVKLSQDSIQLSEVDFKQFLIRHNSFQLKQKLLQCQRLEQVRLSGDILF